MTPMTQPIQVDVPHKLGKAEARRRIAANTDTLRDHIPGGAEVTSEWAGDRLDLAVQALGQSVDAAIEVDETKVRVRVVLPGMLSLFARPIEAALQKKGGMLLEDHRKD